MSTQLREALVRELSPGLLCAGCGNEFDIRTLEIDHVNGRSWDINAVSARQRIERYWREHRTGVALQVLCRGCNAQDGGGRRYRKKRR